MEIVIGIMVLISIFLIYIIYGVLKMFSDKKLKKMLGNVDGIVSSVVIDPYTVLIQKNNGDYSIVGKNKIIELEKDIFGTLTSCQYSFNSFICFLLTKFFTFSICKYFGFFSFIIFSHSHNKED